MLALYGIIRQTNKSCVLILRGIDPKQLSATVLMIPRVPLSPRKKGQPSRIGMMHEAVFATTSPRISGLGNKARITREWRPTVQLDYRFNTRALLAKGDAPRRGRWRVESSLSRHFVSGWPPNANFSLGCGIIHKINITQESFHAGFVMEYAQLLGERVGNLDRCFVGENFTLLCDYDWSW